MPTHLEELYRLDLRVYISTGMCERCFGRDKRGPPTGSRYHPIDRVPDRHMILQRMEAGELFGAVWACMLEFEVLLVDVSHYGLCLHLSEATDPAAHDLCFVLTSYAVMGAQMLRILESLNKRATNGLAGHPTTRVEVMLREVRDLCVLTEPLRVLGFMKSITSFASLS